MNMVKTKLAKAKNLGDPVLGTSENSIYFYIANAPNIKIAIRIKGNNISCRVEAINGEKLVYEDIERLKKIGFGMASKDGLHMSQHYQVEGGPLVACGAYGSMIEQLKFLYEAHNIEAMDWGSINKQGV